MSAKLAGQALGLGVAILAAVPASSLAPALGSEPPERTLVRVNGEAITLDDLLRTLAEMHGQDQETVRRPPNDPTVLLERLITTKLVAHEALEMGFAELPDFTAEFAAFRRDTLIDLTLQRPARAVVRPDPATVDRLYRIAVGEAKLDALFFEAASGATDFLASLAQGATFEAAMAATIEAGTARGGPATEFTKLAEFHPALAAAVLKLATGEVSPEVPLEGGAAVLRLVELRLGEDPGARARAEREALEAARLEAVGAYVAKLEAAHARTDRALLESIDFDVDQAGFERLSVDTRPLVTIEGAPPITVGDLAAALQKMFFHGLDNAARAKKVSTRQDGALHDLIVNRLVLQEAARLRVEDTPEFIRAVRAQQEQMLFSAVVKAVIMPEVRVVGSDVALYYEQHASDYLAPQVVELAAMAFRDGASAEQALGQLRRGADWNWALANVPGRLEPSEAEGNRSLAGKRIVELLPEDVQRGITAPGDLVLHVPAEGPAWVLSVRQLPERRPLELERVRASIEARLREEQAQAALAAWAAELRAASQIEWIVEPEELRRLVAPPARGEG